jgi:ParB family transcriptional regulator, chromosome partitioning protein
MAVKPPPRLGRGLAALLGDTVVPQPGEAQSGYRHLALDLLEPNPFQPRVTMEPQALEELAVSIRSHGVLQPLLARPDPKRNGHFHLIAGERRWRAAAIAGVHEVPVIVRDMSDADAAAVALIENLQREDLNPMEEAEGYSRLVDEMAITQDQIGQAIGKSRAHITNMIRLLNLPDPVQQEVRKGTLTFGHARALLGHSDPEAAMATVLAKGLTVRQTEALATQKPRSERAPRKVSADVAALEHQITEQLGCRAKIAVNAKGTGSLNLQFGSMDELDGWLAKLLG